tara:strand:+ start:1266 stop:1421 length:156 start_codon:yes stop_codon:yes gene_type:complete
MRYIIHKYYGGEYEDEILYSDSLDKAIELSFGAEHFHITDYKTGKVLDIQD